MRVKQLCVARADLNSPPASEPTQRQKIKETDKLKKMIERRMDFTQMDSARQAW